MTPEEYRQDNAARERAMQRVTWVSTGVDFLLAVIKLTVGLLVRSPALIADGIHSFSDLVTDFFVLVINKVSHAEPDTEHPYGHARFETLGTVLIGAVLIGVSVGLIWDNVTRLLGDEPVANPSLWAITAAAVSLLAKEALYHYGRHWARKLDSSLLHANAWHSRTDALSSLVVLGGVLATWFGFGWVEAWAALIVAALIGHMGISLAWNALQELADRGVAEDTQQRMKKEIRAVPGVDNVHELRSRHMGNSVLIDVHIQVGNFISVSEGHQIGDWVMRRLREKFPEITDITLHVDPEDDATIGKRKIAPLRPAILDALAPYPALLGHQRLQIHYRRQRVCLELYYPEEPEPDVHRQAAQALKELDWLENIECFRILPD
ncbi:MAG: cation diffusion facilitator family transporter [Natronospirillum sp.]|uniref:cation diffusion facilitator family transporter n=1 Tax=Natronospirillum sp. TaxID=2812955 RepID=UPI0025F3B812|nr:cation diffusion facilitator family transporter [Natronospirillum sp.]MCH8553119.1 cation diffusion facilitator family transporter [Natronospirillum sp.]